jgi:hypothetical protein
MSWPMSGSASKREPGIAIAVATPARIDERIHKAVNDKCWHGYRSEQLGAITSSGDRRGLPIDAFWSDASFNSGRSSRLKRAGLG